jgi:hypothetical protein
MEDTGLGGKGGERGGAEFRGLAPKLVFGGLSPQNHLTMVIILPPPLLSALLPIPSFININM